MTFKSNRDRSALCERKALQWSRRAEATSDPERKHLYEEIAMKWVRDALVSKHRKSPPPKERMV
jgi:hypothetical protein